jgi:hypothetical protein
LNERKREKKETKRARRRIEEEKRIPYLIFPLRAENEIVLLRKERELLYLIFLSSPPVFWKDLRRRDDFHTREGLVGI